MSLERLTRSVIDLVTGIGRMAGWAVAASLALVVVYRAWVWFMTATGCLGQDPNGDFVYCHATHFATTDLSAVQSDRREFTNGIGMHFVLIPRGKYIMGSPSNEPLRQVDERPHPVRITREFYLAAHEVTVSQFRQFVEATGYTTTCEAGGIGGIGFNPSWPGTRCPSVEFSWRYCGFPQSDDHPVVNVSYKDAIAFCEWLSQREGNCYRLPTEAEWEYACRAGIMGPFWKRIPTVWPGESNVRQPSAPDYFNAAVPKDDGFEYTAPVDSFAANAFGLYDMHGNVREWCSDWYQADYYRCADRDDPQGPAAGEERILRGGSFFRHGLFARSANRSAAEPGFYDFDIGFRVAADAPPTPPASGSSSPPA